MPEIAGGFVAYRRAQLRVQEETDESLREIYQASLSLLYKLLFLLYAEARGLLPVANPGYREQSLTALAQWAAERLDKGLPLSDATHATPRYDALLALFHRIDQGDPSLGIPRYNGGLFNPASPENQFLEQHKLSDRAVARAVDTLVRDAGQPVDYAYIGVRNLGAIYEGLLENRLVLADRPDRSPETCQVCLVNDKGERKASGSYYTPDYIVEYIVQHTLDPLLAERDVAFRAAMERCAEVRRKLKRASDKTSISRLRAELDGAERDAREAFLGLKVLDAAMGSGHFLVNAVDHLTDSIIQRLQAYHDEHPRVPWEWNPIQQLIERVRGEILAEMERQGIGMDPARLDDTAILTRLVMKRCIYGVDLNRMAVELAKVSLWLHSFTIGAPLSFLDHHLRWGNSLIGTDVRTVERAVQTTETGQMGLFAGPFAGLLDLTGLMTEVVERSDTTLADVRQSAEDFERFQHELVPYKQVLDLWVSQYFGNEAATEFLTLFGADVLPALKGEKEVPDKYKDAIQRARELWREKRFFHWDLEFPEVFVDLARRDWAENPGFDAVVGNPPYDELSEDALGHTIDEMQYLQAVPKMAPALGYRINLYRLFIAQALNIVCHGGWQSFIVPLSLLADRFTLSLRRNLLETVQIRVIEQFPQKDDPHDRVFPDAKLSTCLYAVQKKDPRDNQVYVRTHPGRDIGENSPTYTAPQSSFLKFDQDNLSIPGLSHPAWDIVLRLAIDSRFSRFGEFAQALPGELMINRQFDPYLTDVARGEEIIRGSHIGMYCIVEPKQGEHLYLNREKYLSEHARSEKAFHHRQRRVVYQRYAAIDNFRRLIATILPEGYFCSHTVGYLADIREYDLGFLLALLNSILLDWRFNLTSTNNNINGYEVEALPVPRIAFTTPPDERARLVGEGITEATEWIEHTEGKASSVSFGAFSASVFHRWLDARLSPTPHETRNTQHDAVHDLLAHLAQQMIEMNQEKQAEVKGFLAWLAREVGAPPDGLTGKSRLQNYLGDYQKGEAHLALDELLDTLRRNRRHLRVDPSARAFQERLAQEYEASLEKLLPLKARLAATDRLIDLIVYRLYGLTEEEVAVVEGKTS